MRTIAVHEPPPTFSTPPQQTCFLPKFLKSDMSSKDVMYTKWKHKYLIFSRGLYSLSIACPSFRRNVEKFHVVIAERRSSTHEDPPALMWISVDRRALRCWMLTLVKEAVRLWGLRRITAVPPSDTENNDIILLKLWTGEKLPGVVHQTTKSSCCVAWFLCYDQHIL